MTGEEFEHLSGEIIGAAIEVHRVLGPGLLESAYEDCLAWELTRKGLRVEADQYTGALQRIEDRRWISGRHDNKRNCDSGIEVHRFFPANPYGTSTHVP